MRLSINLSYAVIGNTLIKPTITPNKLNAQKYLQFLNDDAPIVLDEVLFNDINRVISQQDETRHPHISV